MLNKLLVRNRGFTLIELLVVISIIAVLSGIVLVVYGEAQKGARDARRKQDLRSIQAALEIYYQKNYFYPTVLSGLLPTYINNLPLDPLNAAPYIYVYSYQSPGQCYALVAILESQSDPERNEVKQYKNCDGTSPSSPYAFVITSRD